MTNSEKEQKLFHFKARCAFCDESFLMRSFELVLVLFFIQLCQTPKKALIIKNRSFFLNAFFFSFLFNFYLLNRVQRRQEQSVQGLVRESSANLAYRHQQDIKKFIVLNYFIGL